MLYAIISIYRLIFIISLGDGGTMSKSPRIKVSVTLRPDVIDFINKGIEDGTFANISHAIDCCVLSYKKRDDQNADRP